MAVLNLKFRSFVLNRTVEIAAILPFEKNEIKEFKTLYLLNGLQNDHTEWLYKSNIVEIASKYNLAVILPNGENSFYVNGLEPNSDFGKYVGQEIVEITRRILPLSNKREDTFIGGVSMGGFGAIRNGLKYSETFSKILAFSPAIHMFEFEPGDPRRNTIIGEDKIFGDYELAKSTDKNPAVCLESLSEKVKRKEGSYPEIYMVCGSEDNLVDADRSFRDKLRAKDVSLIYEESSGGHHFSFWNEYIEKMVEWLIK